MSRHHLSDVPGASTIEALPGIILRAVILLIVLVIGIQVGIHKGRALEREDIGRETATLGNAIASLETQVETLHDERQALGLQNESRGLSLNTEESWTSARQ